MAAEKQHQSSSKMRSIFIDCQSGHHSHASLIKTLTKVYNTVSDVNFMEFVNIMLFNNVCIVQKYCNVLL